MTTPVGLDSEALRFLEGIREHVTVQMTRIAAENQLRSELLQAEMDRRFTATGREQATASAAARDMLTALLVRLDQRYADQTGMLDERFATQTKATEKAFDAQQIAMTTAFNAADKAVQAALAAAKEASSKAEDAADKRFAAVNEVRGQLADQAATLISRVEYMAQYQALSEKVDATAAQLAATSGTIVPRNETDAWRVALTAKIDEGLKGLTAQVAALQLQMTSRLERREGVNDGQAGQRSETRLNMGTVVSVGALVLGLLTFVILYVVKKLHDDSREREVVSVYGPRSLIGLAILAILVIVILLLLGVI